MLPSCAPDKDAGMLRVEDLKQGQCLGERESPDEAQLLAVSLWLPGVVFRSTESRVVQARL